MLARLPVNEVELMKLPVTINFIHTQCDLICVCVVGFLLCFFRWNFFSLPSFDSL